ncbi:MAG: hypothetical protein A2Z43_00245 [Syntrophobacterales bacterium RBG_19FT_COMBO_59_10]|nr:MAG: hypothetical protein A2Z43_00245 [Syntrophobacterales bacterium RBG_19FT_COMBO_59_10]
MVSKKFWDTLSAADKKALKDAAKEATVFEIKAWNKAEGEKYGCPRNSPLKNRYAVFQNLVRKTLLCSKLLGCESDGFDRDIVWPSWEPNCPKRE